MSKLNDKLTLERKTLLQRADAREAEAARLGVCFPADVLREIAVRLRGTAELIDYYQTACAERGINPEVG